MTPALDITPFQDVAVLVLTLIPERIMARPMAVSTGVMIMGRPQMTMVAVGSADEIIVIILRIYTTVSRGREGNYNNIKYSDISS